MEVRRLGRKDEALARVACGVFGREGEIDPGAFLSRSEASLIVAADDEEVFGWVYGHELVHPDGERTMLLYALDVAEHARRRGIGTTLVDAFIDDARERGCTEVWVLTDDANPGGLAMYQAAHGTREPVPQVMFTWKLGEGRHS